MLNRAIFVLGLVIVALFIFMIITLISRSSHKNDPVPTNIIVANTATPTAASVQTTEQTPQPTPDNTAVSTAIDPTEIASEDIIYTPGSETEIPATEPSKTNTPPVRPTPTIQPTPTPPRPTPTVNPTPTPDAADYTEITVLSAGDIMFHMAQVRGAYVADKDTYDFWPTYQYVAPIVQAADLAVVNFESTLYDSNYSGYPGFNSPYQSLQAIKDAGFDTLLFANNHCYDRELIGVKRTLAHFRDYGFTYLGATDDLNARPDKFLLLDVKGIKVGMLNYADSVTEKKGSTYTINDLPLADGDWEYLNMYVNQREDEYLYPRVQEDIRKLKEAGADIIIAYMHWGIEYETSSNSGQRKIAQKLCDYGVDCIIGGHPHIVQEMDVYTSSDKTRQMVCFYSLGNYVSNQNRLTLPSYSVKELTENGLMVKLYIRKYDNGSTVISKLECIPTWVHRYERDNGLIAHEIIPLPVASGEEDNYGLYNSSFGVKNSKAAYEMTYQIFRDKIDEYNNSHS